MLHIGALSMALLLLALLGLLCDQAAAQISKQDPAVDLLWGVKIPMRDGIKLNATVYKPQTMEAPLPVVFTLTPYGLNPV